MDHISKTHQTNTPLSASNPISMRFDTLKKEQEDLVKGWLKQDYVAEFWHGAGLQSTLNSISRFVRGEETPFTIWIAYDNDIPFGYLMTTQVSFEKDSLYAKYIDPSSRAITLDLLIGNRAYLGKGLATEIIREFISQKFSDITDIFIDPSTSNAKAIHVYEKAGFQKLEEFIPEWDPSDQCILMRLKKLHCR